MDKLKNTLIEMGALKVNFGNLTKINPGERFNLDYGIIIAIPFKKEIIKQIIKKPSSKYYENYHELTNKLDELALFCANYLIEKGYEAIPLLTTEVKMFENNQTLLPYKTIATLSGLGWIGKNNLLTTKEFGSAFRFIAILTSAPLLCEEPIIESFCGECIKCIEICDALNNKLWNPLILRDEIINYRKCLINSKNNALKYLNLKITACGRCMAICPYTQRYLKN